MPGERITSGSIEQGVRARKGKSAQILAVRLFTNRGRQLLGQAHQSEIEESATSGKLIKDGVRYEQISNIYFDSPFDKGTLKGFYGRSDDSSSSTTGICRLGLIWGAQTNDQISSGSSMIPIANELVYADGNNKGSTMISEAAQSGTYKFLDEWHKQNKKGSLVRKVPFSKSYSRVPKLLYALSVVDLLKNDRRAIGCDVFNISASDFEFRVTTHPESETYQNVISWLALPISSIHFEHGTYATIQSHREVVDVSQRIVFNEPFASAPKVCVWLQEFNSKGSDTTYSLVTYDEVEADSFKLVIKSSSSSPSSGMRIGWVAYPAEEHGRRIRSGRYRVANIDTFSDDEVILFKPPYSRLPARFIGLNEFDITNVSSMRVTAEFTELSPENITLECGTWGEHTMKSVGCTWLTVD